MNAPGLFGRTVAALPFIQTGIQAGVVEKGLIAPVERGQRRLQIIADNANENARVRRCV